MSHKEVIKQLKSLKSLEVGGQPQESWVLRNKEIMMSQIQPPVQNNTDKYLLGEKIYYVKYLSQAFKQVFRPIVSVCAILLLFLGYTAMITVANASLPGDMLYPIKTTSEKVQLSLTFDDEKKVQLQMDFVSRRGDELQQLARNPDDTQAKKDKISQTAKKISQDVKNVQKDLNKIVTNSPTPTTLNVAKEVDDKTLKVEKDIVNVHASLSVDVKREVSKDIKEAISDTEDTGTSALSVIAKTVEANGDKSGVSGQEVVNRVNERIKNAEITIVAAAKEIDKMVTSTSTVISASGSSTTSIISTTTIQEMKEKPKQAQVVIDQAKDLLERKDINSAIEKIKESKEIVTDVIEKTPAIDTDPVKSDSDSSTTTQAQAATSSTEKK
ncbi:MAG: DUF5667 domain-containing protein [Candidatus Buchananbacteria bacterium]